jgi:hypothetical protein
MSYKPESLFSIVGRINQTLFLPHIQRPFVWEEDQMLRLFDSLMRGYPIQTLLFWRTKDQIKPRRFMDTIDWDADLHALYKEELADAGREKTLVLDGQQRLQSLYAMFGGAIHDRAGAREAWFDVISGDPAAPGEMKFTLVFALGSPGPTYYRLRNLLGKDEQKNANSLAREINTFLDSQLNDTGDAREDRKERVRDNISQLVSLMLEEKHFWIQTLDGVANNYPYQRILEIFVRVNSGGTKLEPADLMFATIKVGWDNAEAEIEDTVTLLNQNTTLHFDKSVILKALVLVNGAGSVLSPDKFDNRALVAKIDANWAKADAAFAELRDFIVRDLCLYTDKVVRSYLSFIPLFHYLYLHPRPDPNNRALMKSFFYRAQLFSWFRSGTDSRLDKLNEIVAGAADCTFPLAAIKAWGTGPLGLQVDLTASDLILSRHRQLLLNLLYVETQSGSAFNVAATENEPHIDHIYPRSQLAKLGLTSAEINHIGNFRYIGASDNKRKRAELPDSYFSKLKAANIDIKRHLLLDEFAQDPTKMVYDVPTYTRFRDARAAEILCIATKVVNI